MSTYTIQQVSQIVSGNLIVHNNHTIIRELLTDSRKVNVPVTSLFFALVTQRNDGHKYIEELIKKGIQNFCVHDVPRHLQSKANFIFVKDTLDALQALTAYHREQFNLPVIGITGSNGKTIIKEWLWQLLSEEKTIVRSPQSYNSQIGVPLSVWQISDLHNLAIFEAGISQPGEMERLQKIIKPGIGIITNIGKAHDQYFTTHEQKASEKLKLFRDSNTIIYCRDSELIHSQILLNLLAAANTEKSTGEAIPQCLNWGYHEDAQLRILTTERDKKETTVISLYKGLKYTIRIPFTDDASVENAMHCLATMILFGYGPEVIGHRMLKLQQVAMRLEMKEGINNCVIINDTYSSDPESLANALDFLVQQTSHEKKTLILSDMLQSSVDEEKLYSSLAVLLESKGITRVIGIGPAISKHSSLFPMQKQFFASTDDFIDNYSNILFRNESILIKGARIFTFERIIDLLQQKSHETILEVNLGALIHNLNYFRSLVLPDTKIMVMVKAFSYGSGSYEIANALQFHHADYLAVAYTDEGVELRKAGISLPIMVMNPEMTGMDSMIRYKLEPEIYSFRTLQLFIKTLKLMTGNNNEPVNIHIKLDTGMHRLGFMENEIDQLVEELNQYPQIRVISVFSHLAASESWELDYFTEKQIKLFEHLTWILKDKLGYSFMRHILNSAGIIRHPYAQFDMVRLGISLYGISSLSNIQKKLETVNSLKTVISQIKVIPEGDTVGYGCNWKAQKESVIAIVPVGYADGFGRKLGNGVGSMCIRNKQVPVVGNINMDMTALDITGIDAEEGDEVIVFGNEISINKIAEQMNTIPYEILTGISRRVKRIYYQE
ncbi:MAG TPA: bifunctional UDP-N-acetylmuramoyl-tripeptide:D-alanyl-D-alanine ligase/alanine racemase [Lentimicrobium sp.]|nr:bifunctional UDP-N-acetylmuramoyl-tripeptide:D-alanyl-D-alanine ligase/alanine racemase [Lentimicrobium sp.]